MAFLNYDGLLYFWQKIKALLAGKVDKVDGKGLSTNDYTTAEKTKLAGLMNYPILGNRAWLAIPADADEESARAAAAAILWLYTSKAGESALIDTLDLITPWGTGSNQNAAAAMQAAQVTAGILPGAALDKTQAAALQQAQRGLYYEADGITLRDGLWDEDAAAAWRSAVMAALGAESAEADDN